MPPITPTINKPHDTGSSNVLVEYSTNMRIQTVTGTADPATTAQVRVNGSTTGVTYNTTTGAWSLLLDETAPSLASGTNTFTITAYGYDQTTSTGATLKIHLVLDGSLGFVVSAPSGISVDRHSNRTEFILTHNEDVLSPTGYVVGFNFYAAADPGGGLAGYTLLNTQMVTAYKEIVDELDESEEEVDTTEIVANTYVKTTTTTETYVRRYKYAFNHVRTNTSTSSDYPVRDEANDAFAAIPDATSLYYVATAVGFDESQAYEYESTYSSELPGLPLVLSTRIRDLSPRTLADIQKDAITQVLRVQSNIDVKPGTVTRDVHIDPPSFEANRLWYIADFIHRAQSFLTLIQIDDPEKTGTSVAVSASKYKQALGKALDLTDEEVQQVIDDAFDKLAGNSLTVRRGATKSTGQAVLQRTSAPSADIVVPAGRTFTTTSSNNTRAVTFVSTSTKTMVAANAASYYNAATQRYELTIPIEASTAGSSGNVAAGRIGKTNATGFSSVTNREATLFGQDVESNLSLAERAMLSYVSVDTGTAGGYLRKTLDVNGVLRARIVDAGDELMMRDYDEVRMKHIGGKVDVWVQGTQEIEVSETFAYKYLQELNIRFEIVGDPSDLKFRTTSANVTPDTPIFAMLDDSTLGLGLRNVTTAEDFDLTNVVILDYRTIQLDSGLTQPAVGADDLIAGDYKYRDAAPFIPSFQPVRSIASIASTSSTLTSNNYTLVKTEDPLLEGYSTIASDYVDIVQSGGVPTGNPTVVTNEDLVLVGTQQAELGSVGVDITTIVVTDLSNTVTYDSDLSASPTPDYFIEEGSLTTPPKISRNEDGRIFDGQALHVSYTAEENFTITYAINNVLQKVDEVIQRTRHVTADVIVKQTIENEVVLSATVVLKEDADQAEVDIEVRTNLSILVNRLYIGQDLHQSDVISAIEKVAGVDFVVTPMTKMHKADGSLILRNQLDSDSVMVVEGVTADVYLLTQELDFSTSEGGGPTHLHRGVFKDDLAMELFSLYTDFCTLDEEPGRAMIIGADGIEIPGFSDSSNKAELTGNRVLVTLPKGDATENHTWAASYIVDGESGVGDIIAYDVEYLVLGDTTLVYTVNTDEFGNTF
jgi:hypothetical protein